MNLNEWASAHLDKPEGVEVPTVHTIIRKYSALVSAYMDEVDSGSVTRYRSAKVIQSAMKEGYLF